VRCARQFAEDTGPRIFPPNRQGYPKRQG
jgi:hypothetical protein